MSRTRGAARALADLDARDPRRAQLALVVLEGWAGARAPAQLGSAVRGLLTRAEIPNGLRFQALRVAARLGIVEPLAGDPASLLLAAYASGHFDELARLLRGNPSWPPDAWAEDAADPALEVVLRAEGVRIALVDAWLARGEIEAAARPRTRRVERAARDRSACATSPAEQPRLREAVVRAASARGLSAEESGAWLVACGVATDSERRARRGLHRAVAGGRDRMAGAGRVVRRADRRGSARALVGALRETSPEVALAAAQRALRAIRTDLDDHGEREFLQSVRGAVRAERGGPLDRAFRSDAWPPAPPASVRALRTLDRDPAHGPR